MLYLATCLLSVSVMTLTHYFFSEGDSPFWLAFFFTHFIPVYFLFGPFLYFYVRSVLTDRTGMCARDLWHFIPSLLFLAHIFPYLIRGWDDKLGLAADIIRDPRSATSVRLLFPIPSVGNYILRNLSSLGYITYCLIWVLRFERHYPDRLRIPRWDARKVLRFLKMLVGVCLFASLMFLLIYGNYFFDPRLTPMRFIGNPMMPLLVIGLLAIPLIILFNPEVLYGIPRFPEAPVPQAVEVPSGEDSDTVMGRSALRDDSQPLPVDGDGRFQGLAERILAFMEAEKPYLSPDFSIEDLALWLDVPKHHVYYCYNSIFKTRFSRIRSEFRVRHVQVLIRRGANRDKTLEAIGLESGFSSPSTFYAVFREVAGMTPSEYLQSLDQVS